MGFLSNAKNLSNAFILVTIWYNQNEKIIFHLKVIHVLLRSKNSSLTKVDDVTNHLSLFHIHEQLNMWKISVVWRFAKKRIQKYFSVETYSNLSVCTQSSQVLSIRISSSEKQ